MQSLYFLSNFLNFLFTCKLTHALDLVPTRARAQPGGWNGDGGASELIDTLLDVQVSLRLNLSFRMRYCLVSTLVT